MDPPDKTSTPPVTSDAPVAPEAAKPASASPPVTPPAPAPAPTTTPAADTPLDPQTPIEFPQEDGSLGVATLQDMLDAYKGRGEQPDAEMRKKIELFDKAVASNDRDAAHALMDLYMPEAAKPEATADDRLAALQTEVQELRKAVDSNSPVVAQIEEARVHSGVTALIKQQEKQLPYLAQDAVDGAKRVTAKLMEYRQAAKAQYGMTSEQFDKHPRRQQILAAALMDCERSLKGIAERFKGFVPTETPVEPAKTGGVVDDQVKSVNHIPARFHAAGSVLTDASGQAVTQMRHGAMETVPAAPLGSEPSGSAVGPVPAEALKGGPVTPEQLKANMRLRMQEMTSE